MACLVVSDPSVAQWGDILFGLALICVDVLFQKVKGGYPIIFASNVFHNSHLIQKCIQNQQLLNQMRVVKNIGRKDDRMNSL